ncbi:hypothetical protein JND45_12970 [Listeria monocytogenes]|uniref:hypothetical protein n=1 Tax=Listeria monocytogenes TaxID=1639 RepID=UPI001402CFAC|nr:hypothetical protein [Listeria monocytogenes]EEP9903803.1 hypothetical protein [Listeria monocytogenes]EGN3105604.1 hypothetical protein [Listeria monocytogenes]EHA6133957.1 hypothetical protein [Listeria monocytogenes]EHQ6384603.1 hypothetical protein [Listeria monocytogenes]EHW6349062.1 hypothetical protein [Listeria monocytogenes]
MTATTHWSKKENNEVLTVFLRRPQTFFFPNFQEKRLLSKKTSFGYPKPAS